MEAPTASNGTTASLTGGAATKIATSAGGPDYRITIACPQPFDILFGDTNVGDPGDNSAFPAGVYEFRVRSGQTHFKINAHTTCVARYWRSSIT